MFTIQIIKAMNYIQKNVPCWALPYIINADFDGYSDAEIKQINEYLHSNNIIALFPVMDKEGYILEYFSISPEFGLSCNCCNCYITSKK